MLLLSLCLYFLLILPHKHIVFTPQRLKYQRQMSEPTDPNPARHYKSSFCKHSQWIQGSTLRRPQCSLIRDKQVYNKQKPVTCDNGQSWLRWLQNSREKTHSTGRSSGNPKPASVHRREHREVWQGELPPHLAWSKCWSANTLQQFP